MKLMAVRMLVLGIEMHDLIKSEIDVDFVSKWKTKTYRSKIRDKDVRLFFVALYFYLCSFFVQTHSRFGAVYRLRITNRDAAVIFDIEQRKYEL